LTGPGHHLLRTFFQVSQFHGQATGGLFADDPLRFVNSGGVFHDIAPN
jgi:hypothetical protein